MSGRVDNVQKLQVHLPFWHKCKWSVKGSLQGFSWTDVTPYFHLGKLNHSRKEKEFNKCSRTKAHNLLETNESHNHTQSCFPFILLISAHTIGPPHCSLLKIRDPLLTSKSGTLKRPKAISKYQKNGISCPHLNFHLLVLFFLFPIKAVGGGDAVGLLPYIFPVCLFWSFLAHSGTGKQCGWQKGSFHHFIKSAFF